MGKSKRACPALPFPVKCFPPKLSTTPTRLCIHKIYVLFVLMGRRADHLAVARRTRRVWPVIGTASHFLFGLAMTMGLSPASICNDHGIASSLRGGWVGSCPSSAMISRLSFFIVACVAVAASVGGALSRARNPRRLTCFGRRLW